MEGWVKLYRRTLEWEWWGEPNTVVLFMYLLMAANHTQSKWRGETIEAGQLLTGRNKLAEETGLTVQNVRTALRNLQSTNEITITSTSKYSIITITKWDEYQDGNQQDNQQSTSNLTSSQPAANHQVTTSKNINNINKYNNNPENVQKSEFVQKTKITLSFCPDVESRKYAEDKNLNADEQLKKFINHYAGNGQLRADWNAAFRAWCDKAREFGKPKAGNNQSSGGGDLPPDPNGQWIARMHGFQNKGFWLDNWGPKPGEEFCQVPSEVLKKFTPDTTQPHGLGRETNPMQGAG